MIFFIISALIIAALVVSFAIRKKIAYLVNWSIFAVALIAMVLVVFPVRGATFAIAKSDAQTFTEYWNGYEESVSLDTTTCTRDGWCRNTFQCDPYLVTEIEYYTDSDGNTQSRTVTRTEYHDCPYATEETSYTIHTTIGEFSAGDNLMTGEQWRAGHAIPGGRVTEPPVLWSEAKERIDSGNPGGVTKTNNYKNFILASNNSILKSYSESINELESASLLPSPPSGTYEIYRAQKAFLAGKIPGVDMERVNRDLQNLNGAFGMELKGNLRLVLVNTDELTMSAEDYKNSLHAYWSDAERFDRYALPKNDVVVILGVSASSGTPTVAWAKGFTGMPVGNEGLLQDISSKLPGALVDESLIGSATYDPKSGEITHGDGLLESVLWGENKFERVSMEQKDEGDVGTGFAYLSNEWAPSAGVITIAYVISGVLALGLLVLGICLAVRFSDEFDPLGNFFNAHKRHGSRY